MMTVQELAIKNCFKIFIGFLSPSISSLPQNCFLSPLNSLSVNPSFSRPFYCPAHILSLSLSLFPICVFHTASERYRREREGDIETERMDDTPSGDDSFLLNSVSKTRVGKRGEREQIKIQDFSLSLPASSFCGSHLYCLNVRKKYIFSLKPHIFILLVSASPSRIE